MSGRILQADPGAALLEHRAEYIDAIARVLDSRRYVLGPEVERFEGAFAAFVGVEHCVGVASGTDALELALRAFDIGPGDAVITVSHTAVPTAMAILRTGATPVLVDVDEASFTMAADRVEESLDALPAGLRARAIVPVHLYGAMADLERIGAIAADHGLVLIEDCAQAHGAHRNGRRAGSVGDAAAFSFYPTKNLGAIGDAGAVVTDDTIIADRVRRLRQYGWAEGQDSIEPGQNSRLDELQAAILSVGLAHLDDATTRRRAIADTYDVALRDTDAILPVRPDDGDHVYHQYVIRVPHRDAFRRSLADHGVGTAIHYRIPVHRQRTFREGVAVHTSMPVTERIVDEIVSLPVHPSLDREQAGTVARSALEALASGPVV